MKKLTSIILILSIVCSVFAISGINSAADSKYDKLYKESREYRNTIGGGAFYYPLFSPGLTVLLYTKAAEEMTLKKVYDGGDIFGVYASLLTFNIMDGPDYLECPEIYEAVEPCVTLPYGMRESRSYLRECIKYFGITKSELLEGFRLMKEDPDYIRPILSFLTDEEYESAKLSDGTFGRTDYPDFVIEAMFIKDDAKAHDLITYNNAVYIPELGRVTEYYEIESCEDEERKEILKEIGYLSIDDLVKYDLTSDSMGVFIDYLKNEYFENRENPPPISRERIDYLESEREKQLANPKTGEAWYFIPAAAVSLVAGIFVICPRRKRILER